MGRPVPPPIPPDPVAPGELCVFCWGPDGIFGDGPTPSQITVEIDGVAKGPGWVPADGDPPEGSFDLPQLLIAGPCVFIIEGVVNINVLFDVANTVVDGSKLGGPSFFIGETTGPCILVVKSNLDAHFSGGTATITLPGIA